MLGKIIPNEVLEHIAKIAIAACSVYTGVQEQWDDYLIYQREFVLKSINYYLENPSKTPEEYLGIIIENNYSSEAAKTVSIQNKIFRAVVIAHIPSLEMFIKDHQHELKSE